MSEELDRLWGIERYEDSDAFGEVVCPVIFLWDKPQGKKKIVWVTEHGTEVRVLRSQEIDEKPWCLVETVHEIQKVKSKNIFIRMFGKKKHIKATGWITASLLKKRGA